MNHWFPLYSGAIFTAVCAREVVAPPIITGILIFNLSISLPNTPFHQEVRKSNCLKPIISTFSLTEFQ